jgi:uncharacterized protein YggE
MKATTLYVMCLLPMMAWAQLPSSLTISGKSVTEVTPDITVINISLSALDMDYGSFTRQIKKH